jgi:hypothetical protein
VGQALSETLGIDDPDAFWATVAANVDAERFASSFISDVIPPGLRRIIEFLNSQMTQTDVLARPRTPVWPTRRLPPLEVPLDLAR